MKKSIIIIALFASVSAFAQEQLQKESATMISMSTDKILQLAEAMPAAKFDWSPEEGVRTFAGVLQHVISANYFFATKLGATLPDGVNMATIEQDVTSKDDLMKAVKQSSELIVSAIKNVKDDELPNTIVFPFPGEFTTMSAILIGLAHTDEHLGQLIAYARSNSVAPPWSGN